MNTFDATGWTGRNTVTLASLPAFAHTGRHFAVRLGPLAHIRAYGLQICALRRDPPPLCGSLWRKCWTFTLFKASRP